eukprot:m.218318 g.218318  ORF g.218318 m.218318 type:complete len:207 (+) comp54117_c0_seq9:1317-1937(+)
MTGQPDDDDYPQKCSSKSAWIWVTLFIVGFVGGDLYANVLYKKTSAFWTMLLNTLSGPLTAAAFNFPQIVGQENYVQFGWYSGASFAVIFIGVIFRGTPTESVLTIQDPLLVSLLDSERLLLVSLLYSERLLLVSPLYSERLLLVSLLYSDLMLFALCSESERVRASCIERMWMTTQTICCPCSPLATSISTTIIADQPSHTALCS